MQFKNRSERETATRPQAPTIVLNFLHHHPSPRPPPQSPLPAVQRQVRPQKHDFITHRPRIASSFYTCAARWSSTSPRPPPFIAQRRRLMRPALTTVPLLVLSTLSSATYEVRRPSEDNELPLRTSPKLCRRLHKYRFSVSIKRFFPISADNIKRCLRLSAEFQQALASNQR